MCVAINIALQTLNLKLGNMNELLDRLIKEAGLNQQQAQKAIEIVADFVKERFPMLGGAVDQIFGAGNKNDE